MTKNNSYDHRAPCGTTNSFSEIARKLGTGFASRASEHDEAAARHWLFIIPQEWTWWVWLVTACLLQIWRVLPDLEAEGFQPSEKTTLQSASKHFRKNMKLRKAQSRSTGDEDRQPQIHSLRPIKVYKSKTTSQKSCLIQTM